MRHNPIGARFRDACLRWYQNGNQSPAWVPRQAAYRDLLDRHPKEAIARHVFCVKDTLDRLEAKAREGVRGAR